MNELINLFQFPFMQRALIGALLMGILGGLLGSFVILRSLSFFSHAVGHAAFLGIVIGVLLGINPIIVLLPFSIIFGIAVLYLVDRTQIASDNILSILLSGLLAIAIILSSFIQGYRGNLTGLLFGDILAIGNDDLIIITILLLISAGWILMTFPQQILVTLNLGVAKSRGIAIDFYRYSFVILLSLTVAVSIKAIGILLVNAFLVIPAASAKLITNQFNRFLLLSIFLGMIGSVLGMIGSGLLNFPSGPMIVLIQFGGFVLILGIKQLITQK